VVVDEAHHTVASTYKTILQGLGLIEEVLTEPAQDDDAQDRAPVQQPTGAWRSSSSGGSMSGIMDAIDEAAGVLQLASWKGDNLSKSRGRLHNCSRSAVHSGSGLAGIRSCTIDLSLHVLGHSQR
jgi:hypothetical protein